MVKEFKVKCPHCRRWVYIGAIAMSISIPIECPHCKNWLPRDLKFS